PIIVIDRLNSSPETVSPPIKSILYCFASVSIPLCISINFSWFILPGMIIDTRENLAIAPNTAVPLKLAANNRQPISETDKGLNVHRIYQNNVSESITTLYEP